MGRERTPIKRQPKDEVTMNVAEIWRNPDMQDEVIKECKKLTKQHGNITAKTTIN